MPRRWPEGAGPPHRSVRRSTPPRRTLCPPVKSDSPEGPAADIHRASARKPPPTPYSPPPPTTATKRPHRNVSNRPPRQSKNQHNSDPLGLGRPPKYAIQSPIPFKRGLMIILWKRWRFLSIDALHISLQKICAFILISASLTVIEVLYVFAEAEECRIQAGPARTMARSVLDEAVASRGFRTGDPLAKSSFQCYHSEILVDKNQKRYFVLFYWRMRHGQRRLHIPPTAQRHGPGTAEALRDQRDHRPGRVERSPVVRRGGAAGRDLSQRRLPERRGEGAE